MMLSLSLIALTVLLAFAAFLVGILPLFFTFSPKRLAWVSTYGTGLLLGAAMGVIIPEGIDAIYDATMCLLLGFTLMLFIENLLAPHSHSSPSGHRRLKTTDSASPPLLPRNSNDHDRDRNRSEDEDAERASNYTRSTLTPRNGTPIPPESTPKSNPNLLTLGLVVHSLADGLALGSSFISVGDQGSSLSFIVFLAIIIHKAPTALALTTSLLPILPSRLIKYHLAAFSLASPISCILTYMAISFVGGGEGIGVWTGRALLFSGGTFLYVATMLSPLSHSHSSEGEDGEEMGKVTRTGIVVLGMFTPVFISSLVDR